MTTYLLACGAAFLVGFLLNMLFITVFYHRGLAHGAVLLSPTTRRLVARTGNWVTGLDPKAWTCMHRLHHRWSDRERDPHSPRNLGIPGVFLGQLRSYERILRGLLKEDPSYTRVVADLRFPVSPLNARGLWWLPYALQVAIVMVIGVAFDAWLLGVAWWLGLMSHPVQGWMVNSFGHAVGYRNFDTPDDSRNNRIVALLAMGEGLQNNHHHDPGSARFSVRPGEWDPGYALCRLAEASGLVTILGRDVRKAPPPAW